MRPAISCEKMRQNLVHQHGIDLRETSTSSINPQVGLPLAAALCKASVGMDLRSLVCKMGG